VDVDELYGLAPERFVAERNALARELRRAGRRDEAAEVAALRKPSVAARAVNQLAREHAPQLRRLFEAGDALSDVQSEVLAGQADGRTLGEAAERERAAVSALVDAARELLVAEGQEPSAGVLERVSDTLHAAALDDEARQPVQQGRLERELRHVGLGIGALDESPAPAKAKRGKQAPAPAETKPGKPAETPAETRRADQAAARRQAEARKRAAAAEADARRQAERTLKAVEGAERKRSRAAEALEQAEAALAAAREDAVAADQARRRAQRELDTLPGS
jgi:hypothetical protein